MPLAPAAPEPEYVTQGGHEFAVLDWKMDLSKATPRDRFIDVPSFAADEEPSVYSKKQKTKAAPI